MSTSTTTTTFVLVPGSFVTPVEYDKMIPLLESKGHSVKAIELLSVNDGSRMPPATFEDDVSHIRSAILEILDKQKRNVVLGVHSYSGIPGSSAVSGLGIEDRKSAGHNTAVTGIVYIASFLPILNESLRDIMNDHMPPDLRAGFPGDYYPRTSVDFAPYIFNDMTDEAEVAKYHGAMERHASDSYDGRATYEAWKYIQSVQIIPQSDFIIPVMVQEDLYERTVKEGGKVRKVYIEGGGHCVNISRPNAVVKQLLKIAEL